MEQDLPAAPIGRTSSRQSFPNNLPLELNRFIGRERELKQVRQLIWTTRLLTLIGPGGCGKTRLAIKVGETLLDAFRNGVWFIDLARLSKNGLVPQAIGMVFEIQETAGQSFSDALINFLRPREMLIILDNCEHVLSACADLVTSLMQSCPQLFLLATSREAFNIDGEVVWPTPPLSFIRPGKRVDVESLIAYEAPRLFLERAAANQPNFAATRQNALAIAQICKMLDGLPLAIELAAARVSTWSTDQIAEQLGNRFDLLNLGRRTTPARHQTLRAMIDWSYGLLSATEKKLYQRLAVFEGGWTLEAVEAVCSDAEKIIQVNNESVQTVNILSRLVEKSLVIVEPVQNDFTFRSEGTRLSAVRYRFLETIRQYAREKLTDGIQADDINLQPEDYVQVRDRHLVYFTQWVKRHSPDLNGPDRLIWLERFEREHENIRAALEWGLSNDRCAEPVIELAVTFAEFLLIQGFFSEGRSYLSSALSRQQTGSLLSANHLPDRLLSEKELNLRALGLISLAEMAFIQSDFLIIQPLLDEGLYILRALGKDHSAEYALALRIYGDMKMETGDYAAANNLLNESLHINRELNNVPGICNALMLIGWAAMRNGDYSDAEVIFEEFLKFAHRSGSTHFISYALSGMGELAIRKEQYDRARVLLEESLALRRDIGDQWAIGTSLGSLGWAAMQQGDYPRMWAALKESITIRLEIGEKGGVAWCLEKLAEGILQEARIQTPKERNNHYRRAACMYGAAAAIRAPVGSVIDLADQPDHKRNIDNLRKRLGEKVFIQAWNEGEQMITHEKGVEMVLVLGLPGIRQNPTETVILLDQDRSNKPGGLSRREREVATLIMQGRSNQDIAEAMTVELKTVETHIAHIFNKLGFDSRVQIAVWAVEKGLQ